MLPVCATVIESRVASGPGALCEPPSKRNIKPIRVCNKFKHDLIAALGRNGIGHTHQILFMSLRGHNVFFYGFGPGRHLIVDLLRDICRRCR